MTAIYAEDTLRAGNKTQLVELFFESQEHTKGIINSMKKRDNAGKVPTTSDLSVLWW